MSDIIPAIIPTSLSHLKASLEVLPFAPRVQIDIVDGEFAAPASWPYDPAGSVMEVSDVLTHHKVMVDIMAGEVLAAASAWLEAGASELVLHLETITPETFKAVVALKQTYSFALYIAGDDELTTEAYLPYIDQCDGVQLMGIDEVGQQGQSFSTRVVENVTQWRAAYPALPIVIDGSVNKSTLPALKQAGATDFVVGSAIDTASDKAAAYAALLEIVK